MNIKGMISNILPTFDSRNVDPVGKTIKSDSTHDRDANGQEAYQQQGDPEHHEPMSDEQLERAMEHLRNLAGVKEHKWTVHLSIEEDIRYALVKDNLGNIIRKIPERELWTLPSDGSA
jgi:hypothetical protein